MNKYFRLLPGKIIEVLAVAILVGALTGCATTLLTPNYAGSKIRPGYEIPINPDGRQRGVYTSDDLRVEYEYQRQADSLRISGVVRFIDGIKFNFRYVDYFNLGLLIGDSQGAILSNHALVSASWVNLTAAYEEVRFNETIQIPPGAAVMAFTYTGQASEGGFGGGDNGGGNTQFWEYPIVK